VETTAGFHQASEDAPDVQILLAAYRTSENARERNPLGYRFGGVGPPASRVICLATLVAGRLSENCVDGNRNIGGAFGEVLARGGRSNGPDPES